MPLTSALLLTCRHITKYKINWHWRDGLEVKSTCYSSRRPGFNHQHPDGGSKLLVTPVPGDSTPALVITVHTWCTGIHIAKAVMYIK